MNDQIQQMFKIKQRQGQKISLSKLRHNPKQQKIDEETITRLEKLKKYAHHDQSIPTQKLNSYYCSLCGRICLVTNILLESMPKRRTDNATAIDLRSNFVKPNLQKQKIKYVKRDNGVEVQYRWKCQCGIPIAYMPINYEEFQALRLSEHSNKECSNLPFLYAYDGALSEKMNDSKLVSELITYKETILLHLKKKITKK